MGFILLGLAAGNLLGVSGAVLQMFSHGVIGALLFALAGAVYYRTHTRNLNDLSGMALNRTMPFLAFAFVIAAAASMGIPGFSGFAAEITILLGVWKAFPMAVWITGLGMVLVAAFTLRAMKKSFFGDDRYSAPRMQEGRRQPVAAQWNDSPAVAAPATLAEKLGASLLIFATLAVGLYPQLLLDRIMPAVETMRFLRP
jgi:NADH-quinone oxidoreductase subunit M